VPTLPQSTVVVPNQRNLDLFRDLIESGHDCENILQALRMQLEIDISIRTLQRWIKSNCLDRHQHSSVVDRSTAWMKM
jgi:hypothetical protein